MTNTRKILNSIILLFFLATLEIFISPIIDWSTAEQFGFMDFLLFNSHWLPIVLLSFITGLFWKENTLDFKCFYNKLLPFVCLFFVSQFLLFVPGHFLTKSVNCLSFLRAFSTNYLLVLFVTLSMLLYLCNLLVTRIGKKGLFLVLLVIGLLTGFLPAVDYVPNISRTLVSLPLVCFVYYRKESTNTKKKGVLCILAALILEGILFLVKSRLIPLMSVLLGGDGAYGSLVHGALSGIPIRMLWYAMSFILIALLFYIIPDKELWIFTKNADVIPISYLFVGIFSAVFISYYSGNYKNISVLYGNPGILLFTLIILILLWNPLISRLFRLLSHLVRKKLSCCLCYSKIKQYSTDAYSISSKGKLLLSAAVCLFAVFTHLIFSPYELFIGAANDIEFSFSDFWWPALLFGFLVWCILMLLCVLTRGNVSKIIISIIFSITLAGYMQGNFMNIGLGELRGLEIEWSRFYPQMFWNAITWLTFCVLPILLLFFHERTWESLLKWGSLLVFAMQLTALATLLLTYHDTHKSDYYLSTEKEFQVSGENNTIVFILDAFDTKYLDYLTDYKPDYFDSFDGFTFYPNCTSLFQHTFPSETYMLSGTPFDYDCLQDEFFPKAWAGNTPLKQLKKDGYQVRLYVDMNTLIGDRKQLIGSVDNLSTSKRHIPYGRLLGQMYKLTAYRNMPHCLKPAFWLYTEDINAVDQDGYAILDDVFFEQLTTQKLSFSDEDKSFILYHLNGTHGPYKLDIDGTRLTRQENTLCKQAIACMNIVVEYMEQLKALGVYDSSTIFITADHGDSDIFIGETKNPIFFAKLPGQTGSMITSDRPTITTDFWPTILGEHYAGGFCQELGLDKTDRARKRYIREGITTQDGGYLTYEIGEDAQNFDDWKPLDD